jgi:trichoplein keratin filament-binding protein
MARRQEARATAQGMLESLRKQMLMEKEREAELDAMFADEASREWNKRAAEWEKERVARESLMRQVMQERALQLSEKGVLLAQKKLESMQRREDLLRDMEQTQAMMKREKEKAELAKLERRKELEKGLCLPLIINSNTMCSEYTPS